MTFRNELQRELNFPDRVYIFDTTLRDGEQTPGVALMPEEKLEIARQLDTLGVDHIEAGFPITSKGEVDSIKRITQERLNAEIVGLARSVKKDIELAIDCDVDCIHSFIATSDIHMKKKLEMTSEEVISRAVEGVELIKAHGLKCEFSAEDASRSDPHFLTQVYKAVVEAGADRIDIPDTIGTSIPRNIFDLVTTIKNVVSVPIALHCHDDLGLAVANSLSGVEAGAQEIHCCVNGLGERAGNASLEEVVLALHVFYGIKTGIKFEDIYRTSNLVSKLTGIRICPTKAVVGRNAFAHESGIHTDGILSSPETYELLSPEIVGGKRKIVAGKHAGKHGIDSMLKEMGFALTDSQLEEIVLRVKELGDKGRSISHEDLVSIVEAVTGSLKPERRKIKLLDLLVLTGNKTTPKANISLLIDGKKYESVDYGIGPIDAVIKAIQKVVRNVANFRLIDFKLDAISGGSDALAYVTVKLMDDKGRTISARGVREDIVMAGVDAVINAANRLLHLQEM